MEFLLRGCISSKPTSGDNMAKFEEVNQDEAISRWNADNPDDPYARSVPSWYDLDSWVLRIVEDTVVGMAGWKDYGEFALLGGLKARARTAPLGGGNASALLEYRRNKLGTKPKLAGLKSSKMPQESWVQWNKNNGFEINPDKHELPMGLVDKFKTRYGDNWGILKTTTWWNEMFKNDYEWLI